MLISARRSMTRLDAGQHGKNLLVLSAASRK